MLVEERTTLQCNSLFQPLLVLHRTLSCLSVYVFVTSSIFCTKFLQCQYLSVKYPKAVQAINDAIDEYHKFTCLRFVKRASEEGYIDFHMGSG